MLDGSLPQANTHVQGAGGILLGNFIGSGGKAVACRGLKGDLLRTSDSRLKNP